MLICFKRLYTNTHTHTHTYSKTHVSLSIFMNCPQFSIFDDLAKCRLKHDGYVVTGRVTMPVVRTPVTKGLTLRKVDAHISQSDVGTWSFSWGVRAEH